MHIKGDKTMDIAALSMTMAQNKVMTDVNTALMSKALDTVEDNGAQLIKMMEQSVDPTLGQSIDLKL